MTIYIEYPEDERRALDEIDAAWKEVKRAVDAAYEAHCEEKVHKSSLATDEMHAPLRLIMLQQEELLQFHKREDARKNAEAEDAEAECECDAECAREELDEIAYQQWKDDAA